MSLSKLFQRIIWHNNTTPAINEDNLNAMSKAIDDIDDRVILIGDDVVTVIPQIQAYLEQAESIVEAVEELSQNPPYIGANGNWYVFDTTLEAYKDSGVDASITVDIADITMIAVGAQPYVTNTGTSTDPIFHLFLPRSPQGATGNGIANIAKTSTQGLVDTYTITMTDGTTYTFTVTNGQNGSGTGDMLQSDYDNDNTVKNAGGIADYVEGKVAPMLNVLGAKNLLPNKLETQAINGITLTVNNDGTITANGTSTAQVLVKLNNSFMLKKGSYLLSKPYQGASVTTSLLWLYKIDNTSIVYTNTKDAEFTLAEDTECFLNFIIANGITLDNEIIKPMIRPASIQDDTYVPYSMTNQQITPYVQAISNPNLLDNPWFTVNQRGESSYSGAGYTVDRWKLVNANGSLAVNADGSITVTASGGETWLQYRFEPSLLKNLVGKPITLSIDAVKTGGYVNVYSGYYDASNTWHRISADVGVGTTRGIVTKTVIVPSLEGGEPKFGEYGIYIGSGQSVTIYSAKLELGSVSTLAQDTAPNYQQELAKCQRYFYRHKGAYEYVGYFNTTTNFRANLALPVPMRAIPSMTLETPTDYAQCAIYDAQGNAVHPSAIAVDTVNSIVGQPEILLNSTVPTHTQNMCGVQRFNLRIDLSADL